MRSTTCCSSHRRSTGTPARGVRIAARWVWLALLAVITGVGSASALPRRPTQARELLLELPARRDLARLQQARQEWQADPADAGRVERLVAEELRAGRRYADPRYFGQAEAILAPWRARPARPIALDVQWADILQHRHDYDSARSVLDEVLAHSPDEAQARLMRAQMGLAEGRLAQARADCGRLVRAGGVGLACLAQVLGVNGQLSQGYALLSRAVQAVPAGDPARSWMLSALGDMSIRRADPAAVDWLRQAVQADASDQYARLALADALIDHGSLSEAAQVVNDGPRSDGALLRLAVIDARRPHSTRADAAELSARYAEAENRGEVVHLRDRARFELCVLGKPAVALRSATENFRTQREPWDTRLLLEAARAMNDRKAAAPALAWQRESHYEDSTLNALFAWAQGRS